MKVSEVDFCKLCAFYNIWAHKWTDVRFCPVCKSPIYSNRTDKNDGREIRSSIIDYLIFIGDKPMWVECKGRSGDTNFPFKELELHQRQFLADWTSRGVDCAIFLTFGPGRAPKGRHAWLIPWWNWEAIERSLYPRKSIPFDYEPLEWYRLEWDRGWKIPYNFWLVNRYPNILNLPSLYEEERV